MTDLDNNATPAVRTCEAQWVGIEPLSCGLPHEHNGPHHDDAYSWWRVRDGVLQLYGPIQYNRAVRDRCDNPPPEMLAGLMGRK